MSKKRMFSIVTIVCFCTVIFVPIGLVLMWFFTDWKKKLKVILTAVMTALYIGIAALALMLEPSYNTRGLSLPVNYSAGETAFESSVSTSSKDGDENLDSEKTQKKSNEINNEQIDEERLPRGVKKQNGAPGRSFYTIMFFLFMLFLIMWQNYKAKHKKTGYENPYVDTNQYKLPFDDNSKMPTVHFLKLRLNQNEKIYFATETTQKDNEGDFVVTNKRVVVFSAGGDYEFPLEALSAISSVTNSVLLLTCGERKYYIFMPESQMKYALATVRWAYSKIN